MHKIERGLIGLGCGLIRFYQLTLSYFIGGQCRFTPTCSDYGQQALRRHGLIRGLGLGLRRVLRCHPWHPGGLDPVPPKDVRPEDSKPEDSGPKDSGPKDSKMDKPVAPR